MKKLLALLSAAMLLLGLCACGKAISESDLALTLNGKTVDAHFDIAQIESVLGQPDEMSEAVSCVYEGMDRVYTFGDVTVYTYPDGDRDMVMEICCTGGDVKTAAGIGLGAAKSDIEASYGTGYTESGCVLTYTLAASAKENEPATLYFELENDTVTAIGLTSEHRTE